MASEPGAETSAAAATRVVTKRPLPFDGGESTSVGGYASTASSPPIDEAPLRPRSPPSRPASPPRPLSSPRLTSSYPADACAEQTTIPVAAASACASAPPADDRAQPRCAAAATPPQPPRKKQRLSAEERVSRIGAAMRTILECLDDDPDREGLRKTPMRYAKALVTLTSGYSLTPEIVLGDAEFDENHSEMVLVRDIDIFSNCEHHLLPFYGRCHVAYLPTGPVIGLSKIARIVDMYAHRLQVQERLTTQIADAIASATGARGVMVQVSCSHMCMAMRGVKKVGASTITSAARGSFRDDATLRQEFATMIASPP